MIHPCCVPVVCSFLLWLNSLLIFSYPFLSFCAFLRLSLLSSLKWSGPSIITCRGIKVTFIFYTDSRNQVTGEVIQLGSTLIPPDEGEKQVKIATETRFCSVYQTELGLNIGVLTLSLVSFP